MLFQEIDFLRKNFLTKSEKITSNIFEFNYKYATFFIYLMSLLIVGGFVFLAGDLIICDCEDAVTSCDIIRWFCFHEGLYTMDYNDEVRNS